MSEPDDKRLRHRARGIRVWLGRATGWPVENLRRLESIGASREIWIAEVRGADGSVLPLVVRRDADGGLFSDTPFNLRREAAVLDRVKQLGGRVPAIHAVSSSRRMILMEHLRGGSGYGELSPERQREVADACAQTLFELHQIGVERIRQTRSSHRGLPGTEAIIRTLLRYDDLYRRPYEKAGAPVGWLNDALAWLDANRPSPVAPVVLQGDAGPPNFMFEGRTITGLIDWEMTHAGDPADDLAMIYYRMAHLRFERGVGHWYESYARHSGTPYDARRVTYFILLNFVRSALVGWDHLRRNPDFGDSRMNRNRARVTSMLHHVKGSKTALADHGVEAPPAG